MSAFTHRCLSICVAGLASAFPAVVAAAAPAEPLRYAGAVTPGGQINFNDPYRLARRPTSYQVNISLVRNGDRLGGTAELSDGQSTGQFPVSGRTNGDLGCAFSAGPLRFDGLCASEGIVGQGSISNAPAIIQLQGGNARGAWFAAAQGMALAGGRLDLPQAQCLLPDVSIAGAAAAQAALQAAVQASRSHAAAAAAEAADAFNARARALTALEPSSHELAQIYKTYDNEQRLARRGMFNPRATQFANASRDAILNAPQRQQAAAALPRAMATIAQAQSPARRQQAEQLARAAGAAFAPWDEALAAAATGLPATAAGVRDALALNRAVPAVEACGQALAPFGAGESGLRRSLAAQVARLSPAVVAMLDQAQASARDSEGLARRIDALRGTDLFAGQPGIVAAFGRADAKVKSLAMAEETARRRLAAAQAAAQAARRARGYLTADDLMEAFLTELDEITVFGVRTGNVIRVSAPIMPGIAAFLGGEITNVSCTPGKGTSSCTYDLRYWMDSFGLRIPAMLVPVRRTDSFTTTGPVRSAGMRQFLVAMQSAGPSPGSNSAGQRDDPQKSLCRSLGAGVMAGGGDMSGSAGRLYSSWC